MRFFRFLAIVAIVGSSVAYAGRKKTSDFQEVTPMTEEQLADAKAQSKNRLNGFPETMEQPPRPIPWMMVGLVFLTFVGAAPFAIRAYRNAAKTL